MPPVKIPIVGPAYQNIDAQVLDLRNVEVRNLYVNEAEYSEKRPGLLEWVDLGTDRGIDALYWWDKQSVLLAVSNGDVWKITDATGTKTQLTTTDTLMVGNRTSIDDNGSVAALANGGRILTTTAAGPAAYIADGDAPTEVTHIAFIDQYLTANLANTDSWQFSEVGDYTTWRALDIFTAESKPDVIKAFKAGLGELAFFGAKSIEFWVNDGVSPFSRITQATIDRGIGAKDSLALLDESRWIFLDENRKVVEVRGRNLVEVSGPFDHVIQSMSQTETAIGEVYNIHGWPLYLLTFPQDKRTLVYNYRKQDWTEWDYFDQTEGQFLRYRGNAYAYAKPWNLHLVGDHSNGKIYKASPDYYNDDGNTIRCLRRTGFVSHGTFLEKESRNAWFRVKQSMATDTAPNPQMMVRYRNDGGSWGPERWMDLGPAGDHVNLVRLNQLGQYRTRQWEVTFTDDAPFILADAEEEIEVLA